MSIILKCIKCSEYVKMHIFNNYFFQTSLINKYIHS